VDIPPTFNILSLCTGIGGLELGIKLASPNARTICYVEREISACEVLATRIEEGVMDQAPIWSDMRTFDCRKWRDCVDVVVAGYPCQPFSTMGRRDGGSDPRHLWPHVKRILGEVRAPYLFCENVENHLAIGFFEVASSLREMGYKCEALLLGAAEVGSPHSRNRLFFMAHNEGINATHGELGKVSEKVSEKARGCHSRMDVPELGENPFPPGQTPELWEEVLRSNILSVPAFSHEDDGLSGELGRPAGRGKHQIRALGNSIVPMAAAFAFSVLLRRFQVGNE
jgi:DNA (cytosine-5)-methyltransferase 1